jgi:hypothetical protein
MKLISSKKRLRKCLTKHVRNPAEPWGKLLGQDVRRIRDADTDAESDWPDGTFGELSKCLQEQLALSYGRPFYASFQQQQLAADNQLVGQQRAVLYFITPVGLALLCQRHTDQQCQLITAYFPSPCVSWKDSVRCFLDRYCRTNGRTYRIPEKPQRRHQKLDRLERDVEIRNIELFVPENYGLHKTRGTHVQRWRLPEWPEAASYTPSPPPDRQTPRPRFEPNGQPLRGGLVP